MSSMAISEQFLILNGAALGTELRRKAMSLPSAGIPLPVKASSGWQKTQISWFSAVTFRKER